MPSPTDKNFDEATTLANVTGLLERRDAIACALAAAEEGGRRAVAGLGSDRGDEPVYERLAWARFAAEAMGALIANDEDALDENQDGDERKALCERAASYADHMMRLRKSRVAR